MTAKLETQHETDLANEGWTGFITGAAIVGLAWFYTANWHLTVMLVTSARFYEIAGMLALWNAVAVWYRIRKTRRQLMVMGQPDDCMQLHLRD